MPKTRGHGQYGRPGYSQAAHIIKKFGGEPALSKLLGISRITCYRWQYARPYGTDGLVPNNMRPKIEALARYEGVLLLPSDWEVSRVVYPESTEVFHAANSGKTLEELLA